MRVLDSSPPNSPIERRSCRDYCPSERDLYGGFPKLGVPLELRVTIFWSLHESSRKCYMGPFYFGEGILDSKDGRGFSERSNLSVPTPNPEA